MLPIVQRELRTAVRHPKFYHWRVRLAVIELIAAFFIVARDNPLAGGRGSGSFFWFLSWAAFFFCLCEGLRKTSDAISEEKREGTLGFLFLTDLNGFDVVSGKLVGAMLRSFNALLIFVPILAITLILGGTTLGEFWRTVLALGNTLWFSLAICLMASGISREKHLGAAFSFLLFFNLLPFPLAELFRAEAGWVGHIRATSPIMVLLNASDAYYSATPSRFWFGLALENIFGWIAVIIASIVVPRSWQDKPMKGLTVKPRTLGNPEVALAKRRKLLDQSPILWLTYSERHHKSFRTLFYAALFVCLGMLGFAYYVWEQVAPAYVISLIVLTLLFYTHLASQASMNLAEAKRTGAMELLLSTPLRVANILEGQWLALRKAFLVPACILFVWYAIALLSMLHSPQELFGVIYFGKYVAEFVLGVFALAWVGMWMGLTSKSPNRAFFRTMLFGLVVPHVFCLPTLLNQVVLLLIAKEKVKYNFRRFIAERYLQAPGFVLPPALSSDPNTPPVIR